jgi:hypothetical protein
MGDQAMVDRDFAMAEKISQQYKEWGRRLNIDFSASQSRNLAVSASF